jgi:hypothetical protein
MNIRKVLAGSMAAIAAGATVAFGAFAQTSNLGDFVDTSGTRPVPPWVVLGAGQGNPEYAQDVVGAADVAAGMAGYVTVPRSVGGAAEISVSSGGVDLSTANQKIYGGDSINVSKDTLTSEDLPVVLKSSTFEDDDGTEFDYDQYLVMGGSSVALSTSGDDLDIPQVVIQVGVDETEPAYTARVVFNDDLNFSDSDVDGNDLEIFGMSYTVSADSDTDTLVLFGGANKQSMSEGETVTIEVGGISYTVSIIGVSDENTVVVKVNDISRTIDEGQSRTIDDLEVFVDEVFFLQKEAQVSSATLTFGAAKIILDDGNEVKVGDDEDEVDGTMVTFTQGTEGTSVIEVDIAAQDDDEDHVIADLPFTDPVFGTFKLAFGGQSPTVDEMDVFEFKEESDDLLVVKFSDSRLNEQTVEWAFDTNGATAGGLVLADEDEDAIVVLEGANVTEDDYFVINQDDFSRMFEVTNKQRPIQRHKGHRRKDICLLG